MLTDEITYTVHERIHVCRLGLGRLGATLIHNFAVLTTVYLLNIFDLKKKNYVHERVDFN